MTVSVDSTQQNYVSLVFWGEDSSAYKTMLLVDGEYITYRNTGDYQAANVGTQAALPERFFANTTMLPLESTQGRDTVRVTLRTEHPTTATAASRGYYEVLVHTRPSVPGEILDPSGTTVTATSRGVTPRAEADAQIASYRTKQLDRFASLSAKVDSSPSGRFNIAKYENELRWYAEALTQSWSPADTPEKQREALGRIFTTIDRYTVTYYNDVRSLGSGGHQSDWGGYYAELGDSLYTVENLIADEGVLGQEAFEAFLAEPFETGSVDGPNSIAGTDWDGGELTRGEAWERVLKANFDFARTRLSYISNQVHYTYEGAWRAHEGLRVIGSEFYEGKDRSHEILREIWGISPFLGEEVLIGPDGQELDLHHSLFRHDREAEYTDDFLSIVMRGLAQSKLDDDGSIVRREPYGQHYLSISSGGQFRENRYVGNYGETGSWIPAYFWRTWNHSGDEELNDDLLKQALANMHARAQSRWQGIDADGNRVMYMDQVIDDRNPAYPGKTAYTTETQQNLGLLYASLERHMAENADRYSGPEWDLSWSYAREATGFVQQQLADGQYVPYFASTLGTQSFNKDHRVPETWEWVMGGRGEHALFDQTAAGVVLPGTDLELYTDAELEQLGLDRDSDPEPSAWVDVDNLMVVIRDGDASVTASLTMQNYGWSSNGRFHARHPGWSQSAQVRTQGLFDYNEVWVRPAGVNHTILVDQASWSNQPGLLQSGELIPVTYQPGVGETARDNYVADTPYSAYPDVIWTTYGDWFIAINTTREEYGNAATHTIGVPGNPGAQATNLVSGDSVPLVESGGGRAVEIAPGQSVVLRIDGADATVPAPERVDAVVASAGHGTASLTWTRAAGAASYEVSRIDSGGSRTVVAPTVTSPAFVDTDLPATGTFGYEVVAVGPDGQRAASSPRATAESVGDALSEGWQLFAIGDASGVTGTVDGSEITLGAAGATGFGGGDDYNHVERFRADSLAQVSRPATGSFAVSARLDETTGAFSGLVVRDALAPVARYAAVGADGEGNLRLYVRDLDTRVNIDGSAPPGYESGLISPRTRSLGATLAETPFVRIERHELTHRVTVSVSADGEAWTYVAEEPFVSPETLHAGITTVGSAHLTSVALEEIDPSALNARYDRTDEIVDLSWDRPTGSADFTVQRTSDPALAEIGAGGEGWELVAGPVTVTGLRETVLGATAYYRIAARDASGEEVSSDVIAVDGLSLVEYVNRARDIDTNAYTAASVQEYLAALDEIAVYAAEPGAEVAEVERRITEARGLLVPRHSSSFEEPEWPLWSNAGSAPVSYTRSMDQTPGTARTGETSLLFTSTDTTGNAGYNLWVRSPISGSPRIEVKGGVQYRISFWYQLTDYVPGTNVGAYVFPRPAANGVFTGPETRHWLTTNDATEPGEWRKFERLLTPSANVDTLEIAIGFRGSSGSFRVDDLVVAPASEPEPSSELSSVEELPQVDQVVGLPVGDLGLAGTVTGTLGDGRTVELDVKDWTAPGYGVDSAPGAHGFTGTLVLPQGVTNPAGVAATQTVVTHPRPASIDVTGAATVAAGSTLELTATVTGAEPFPQTDEWSSAVEWSIDPAVEGVSIDPAGVVTVAEGVAPATFQVTATSARVPGVSGTHTVTVTEPGAGPLLVVGSVTARCVAGKVHLVTQVRNGDSVSADVVVSSPFGSRTFTGLAPERSASVSFNTRAGSVPAGTITVSGTGADGRTSQEDVAYPATTCR